MASSLGKQGALVAPIILALIGRPIPDMSRSAPHFRGREVSYNSRYCVICLLITIALEIVCPADMIIGPE